MERKNYFSGAPMELVDGYSRMVQAGPFLYCGGTTSVQPDGSVVAEGDSYGQVSYVLNKLIGIVKEAGGCKEDIFSVKIYATPEYDSAEGAKAFADTFSEEAPLLTVVPIYRLTRPTQLVEIELNAIAGCSQGILWEEYVLKKEKINDQMMKIGPFTYLISKKGTDSVEIIKEQIAFLEKAEVDTMDIVKVKRYATEGYLKEHAEEFQLGLPEEIRKGSTFSSILMEGTEMETQMEILAITGLEKKYASITKEGWAEYVQAGPFLYGGLHHSINEDGEVMGISDSERQESYVVETLTKGMKAFGYKPEHMIKFKAYYTTDFGALYGETETPYYEKVYKPVSPLYTGVYVSSVGGEDEIFEMEMMAIK